ncbi:hypothetical protein HMPREF3213_02279 [Heyndrickxia coagulans]|uniref:Uncharacterized protein n=1 Tax=Heyndrickxia coagulans TaxID=1398 RepID=A0A133KLB5_HEYCO|nr:hypothetical protein HMPREF3213_02279 [Heyndrickxia coagulans]
MKDRDCNMYLFFPASKVPDQRPFYSFTAKECLNLDPQGKKKQAIKACFL